MLTTHLFHSPMASMLFSGLMARMVKCDNGTNWTMYIPMDNQCQGEDDNDLFLSERKPKMTRIMKMKRRRRRSMQARTELLLI